MERRRGGEEERGRGGRAGERKRGDEAKQQNAATPHHTMTPTHTSSFGRRIVLRKLQKWVLWLLNLCLSTRRCQDSTLYRPLIRFVECVLYKRILYRIFVVGARRRIQPGSGACICVRGRAGGLVRGWVCFACARSRLCVWVCVHVCGLCIGTSVRAHVESV